MSVLVLGGACCLCVPVILLGWLWFCLHVRSFQQVLDNLCLQTKEMGCLVGSLLKTVVLIGLSIVGTQGLYFTRGRVYVARFPVVGV